MKRICREKGITLISLVVTIIILLILAGVTISTLIGNNGLINRARDASIATDAAETKEQIQLELMRRYNEDGRYTNSDVIAAVKQITSNDIEEGAETTTTKKGNIVSIAELWVSNSGAGVKVGDLFDESGTEEGKLHIGDFINYTAGTWKDTDMVTIAGTGVTPNNSTDKPTTNYQFGGFAVGGSRDGNATPNNTSYAYVRDASTDSAITGWRLFDVSDGVMTLISAGCPEDYCNPNGTNYAYISEYILTGNVNSSADATTLGLETTYKARNWDMYVNRTCGAESASVLTKAKLDAWYAKYTNTPGADTLTATTFQKIYKTDTNCVNDGMYESLIDNYSLYYLSSPFRSYNVYYVDSARMKLNGNSNDDAFGVRVLVSLSSDIKLSDKATDTKTVVSRSKKYTYNVWDLVTE